MKQAEPIRAITTGQTLKTELDKKPLPFRKLNWKEQQERRAKGLCFNCDERYSATHDCKSQFLMLVCDDEEENSIDQLDNPYCIDEVAHELVLAGDISILHSLLGQNNLRSLRVMGSYKEKELSVLIDSGNTHNFVKPLMVEKLQMPSQKIAPFHVYIGNKDTLTSSKICPQVKLLL